MQEHRVNIYLTILLNILDVGAHISEKAVDKD